MTDRDSQQQQRQDAKKTMRLPRNDARCKLETRDLPTHCPAKRPKKRLSDGSRTDMRKREHAQLCELARTSPEVSNSCHCNSAIETCAGARIEISKQRRAGSSDVVDERRCGSWAMNGGLATTSLRLVSRGCRCGRCLLVRPGIRRGLRVAWRVGCARARIFSFFLLPRTPLPPG